MSKNSTPFPITTEVRKKIGYPFPGMVVSSFRTLKNEQRYVVEMILNGETTGLLHIFNEDQLEVVSE